MHIPTNIVSLKLKYAWHQDRVKWDFAGSPYGVERKECWREVTEGVCGERIFFFSSCNMKLNLDYLLERTWDQLSLLRIYTKKPGRAPDFSDPIIMRGGASVEHVCHSIHRSIVAVFKYALVWVSDIISTVLYEM